MDILRDKKLIIGSMLSIAILFAVFLTTGYLGLPFYKVDRGDNLGCFIMLPVPECYSGRKITYLGKDTVGFNLEEETEVYAPFNGAFFEDEILYEDEETTIVADRFVRARFGILDTSSFIVFTGDHFPNVRGGGSVTAGETVAITNPAGDIIHETSSSNFVIYAEDYDLASLFR